MKVAATTCERGPCRIGKKERPVTRRIKWWGVIGVAVFIIGALVVIHYSLRIAALMAGAH